MSLAHMLHVQPNALLEMMASCDGIEVIDVSDGDALVVTLSDGTVATHVTDVAEGILTITRRGDDGAALVLVVPVDSSDELDGDDPYLDLGEGD